MDCIFCDIIARKRPAHFVYENAHVVAFLDKYPIDDGHTLIVPKKHKERITDMSFEDITAVFAAVSPVARSMMRATGAVAFNLAQNNGREAMQIIPHMHVHVIPRKADKTAGWTKRSITSDDELLKIAKRARISQAP